MSNSWNHEIQREIFSDDARCSGTRCEARPVFLVHYKTANGLKERRYCEHHGYMFAKKHSLAIPKRGSEFLEEMDLDDFTDEGLRALADGAQRELVRRQGINQFEFEFDEIGPKEKNKRPFVARLKLKGPSQIDRYFFPMPSLQYGPDKLRVKGTYRTFAGAILEKRMAVEDATGLPRWERFVLTKQGKEIYIGDRHDSVLEAKIVLYLEGKTGYAALLPQQA